MRPCGRRALYEPSRVQRCGRLLGTAISGINPSAHFLRKHQDKYNLHRKRKTDRAPTSIANGNNPDNDIGITDNNEFLRTTNHEHVARPPHLRYHSPGPNIICYTTLLLIFIKRQRTVELFKNRIRHENGIETNHDEVWMNPQELFQHEHFPRVFIRSPLRESFPEPEFPRMPPIFQTLHLGEHVRGTCALLCSQTPPVRGHVRIDVSCRCTEREVEGRLMGVRVHSTCRTHLDCQRKTTPIVTSNRLLQNYFSGVSSETTKHTSRFSRGMP